MSGGEILIGIPKILDAASVNFPVFSLRRSSFIVRGFTSDGYAGVEISAENLRFSFFKVALYLRNLSRDEVKNLHFYFFFDHLDAKAYESIRNI